VTRLSDAPAAVCFCLSAAVDAMQRDACTTPGWLAGSQSSTLLRHGPARQISQGRGQRYLEEGGREEVRLAVAVDSLCSYAVRQWLPAGRGIAASWVRLAAVPRTSGPAPCL